MIHQKLPTSPPGSTGLGGVLKKVGVITALLASCAGPDAIAAGYQLVGGDFSLVASQSGDQISPALGFSKTGKGYIVWAENTDGSGLGIGGQGYSSNGIRSGKNFRINTTVQDDQSSPSVAVFPDGSAFVAWQSGAPGDSAVFGRYITANGVLQDEVRISDAGKDVRTVSVAAAPQGGAIVVWSQLGGDASEFGIVSRNIGPNGVPLGSPRQVNSYSAGNQRGSSVATLSDGSYIVVWTSEGQSGGENVDVVARRLTADGTPASAEFFVSRSRSLNQSPAVAGVPGGGFVVTWCTLNGLTSPATGGNAAAQSGLSLTQLVGDPASVVWGVVARAYSASGLPVSAEIAISNSPKDSQTLPRIAANDDSVMIVWSGTGLDGSLTGVGGRVADASLSTLGQVMVVNERKKGNQDTPTVVSDGGGSFLAIWANWNGLDLGMDLIARRIQRIDNVLAAPPAPIVEAKSAWQIQATWAPVEGLPVVRYDVVFDGGSPIPVTEPAAVSGDFLPSSTHTVKYRYALSDGTTSPYSAAATVVTWGKDGNLDGLPDDWQARYFGSDAKLWPLPGADSDGDGVSDRDEFLAGTDPTNKNDTLRIRLEGGVSLKWNAKVGATYRVQSSGDLEGWTDISGPVFAGETNQSVNIPNTGGVSYFRVIRIR